MALTTTHPKTIRILVLDADLVPALAVTRSLVKQQYLVDVASARAAVGPTWRIDIDCGFPLVAVLTRQSVEELGVAVGSRVGALVKARGFAGNSREELEQAYPRVISEATKAFGSAEVFLEKCIVNPKHIEAQTSMVAVAGIVGKSPGAVKALQRRANMALSKRLGPR